MCDCRCPTGPTPSGEAGESAEGSADAAAGIPFTAALSAGQLRGAATYRLEHHPAYAQVSKKRK